MTKKIIKRIIKKAFGPRQTDETRRRRELILNILLAFSLSCFLIINIIRLIDTLVNHIPSRLGVIYTLLIMGFFLFLLYLSKKGWIKTAASLLIITYSLPMFYSFLTWGADLPAALLLAVLVIIMSGALLGANAAIFSTAILVTFSLVITYLQTTGLTPVDQSWRAGHNDLGDTVAYAALFMVIATVAWLFAHETQKALRRAWQSEKDLRLERDLLEIKVEERTRQIKQMEAEKINQLYRLAEFGRLSSGIFHDLINPLTAVSLNLEQIRNEAGNTIENAKSSLHQALAATRRMEGLVSGIKKQIAQESREELFSLNEETKQIIQILDYKARQSRVCLQLEATKEINIYGDPIKYGQIISNLVANAIEASENENEEKTVLIRLHENGAQALIEVADHGQGISDGDKTKIFEPFFSTKKSAGRGLGLGLASTKSIVEKDFRGSILLESRLGQGSCFTVCLPLCHD